MSIRKILFGGVRPQSTVQETSLTILRIYVGAIMALIGFMKFPIKPEFVNMVAGMGFPSPHIFAWFAALCELVGGICLALGLLTRYAALLIMGVLFTAAFIFHVNDPMMVKVLPLTILFICLHFFISGASRVSLDYKIESSSHQNMH